MQIDIQKIENAFPFKIPLFGETRLEKSNRIESFIPRMLVKLPFTGDHLGEFRLWCNLDIKRVKTEDQAHAKGLLTEAANILSGVALSSYADSYDLNLMLAPPRLIEVNQKMSANGTDYRLFLADCFCDCRVEVVKGISR
jgi:hypothetical protein